jgi:hypothetical protein
LPASRRRGEGDRRLRPAYCPSRCSPDALVLGALPVVERVVDLIRLDVNGSRTPPIKRRWVQRGAGTFLHGGTLAENPQTGPVAWLLQVQSTPVHIVAPSTRSGQGRSVGGTRTAPPSAPTVETSWPSGAAARGVIGGSNVQRTLNGRANWLRKSQRLGRPRGRVRAAARIEMRTRNRTGGMLAPWTSQ